MILGNLRVPSDHCRFPEPASATLLAIGGVLMTRRRR
ncbi:MAG: PEP-CTERM sorting domain-containing protein [Planctomycetes bacterium]|nr:PEP-CTERM sorting domain-containing protein [Planctomycetota bacterium]